MTQVAEILTELQRRGVTATVEGNTLCLKPKHAVDANLLARLREHKLEILDALSRRPAAADASCCEPQLECKHCDGVGECSCPACTLRRIDAPVPCLMCQAEQRQMWLAATRRDSCWHCAGKGTCDCVLCLDRKAAKASFCIVCGSSDTPEGRLQ
jgi:hypothetical protein